MSPAYPTEQDVFRQTLTPVPKQVLDRPAQRRVRLHQPLVELPHKPGVEFLHHRAALGLVKQQPLLGRQFPLSRHRIILVDHRQGFQHVPALLGKTVDHIDEVPPGVRQTVGKNRLQLARQIP